MTKNPVQCPQRACSGPPLIDVSGKNSHIRAIVMQGRTELTNLRQSLAGAQAQVRGKQPEAPPFEHEIGLDAATRLSALHGNIVQADGFCRVPGKKQVSVVSVLAAQCYTSIGVHAEFCREEAGNTNITDQPILDFLQGNEIST